MKRVLILAHREELIYQAVGHAKNAGYEAGVEMGVNRAKREPVVCSTVQTLNSIGKCRWCGGLGCEMCDNKGKAFRMTKFDPWEFGLVITDEAHHGTAVTYRRIYEHFNQNAACKFLFVTATPKRSDDIGMHNICDSVAYKMDLKTAISEGWLCPIRQRFIKVEGLSLAACRTNRAKGDLSDSDVEHAFLGDTPEDEERLLHEVAGPTVQEANGQPTLVFAAGVAHAQKLTAAFNAYDGVTAECVIGTTDKDERKRIIARYKNRETQVLVGCGVFTEGFDAPGTVIVAIARPTASESLYLQEIGRGTRTLPGVVDGIATAEERREAIANSDKPHCVVLDFVGDSGRHKLISVADVLAGEDCEEADLSTAIQEAYEAGEAVDMEELIEKAKESRERKEKEAEQRRRMRTKHRAENLQYTAEDVDLFGGRPFNAYVDYQPSGPEAATQKQVDLLLRFGLKAETATRYSKKQAFSVITNLKKAKGGEFRITFGKHKGKKLKDLPSGYLRWMQQNNVGGDAIAEQIAIMRAEKSQEPQAVTF